MTQSEVGNSVASFILFHICITIALLWQIFYLDFFTRICGVPHGWTNSADLVS
jgi:hypothetical protein